MQIQFHTNPNATGSKELIAWSSSLITEELSSYDQPKSKVAIHLLDESSITNGFHGKCCKVEARLAGMKTIAVADHANTHVQAIFGAIHKLKTSLEQNKQTNK